MSIEIIQAACCCGGGGEDPFCPQFQLLECNQCATTYIMEGVFTFLAGNPPAPGSGQYEIWQVSQLSAPVCLGPGVAGPCYWDNGACGTTSGTVSIVYQIGFNDTPPLITRSYVGPVAEFDSVIGGSTSVSCTTAGARNFVLSIPDLPAEEGGTVPRLRLGFNGPLDTTCPPIGPNTLELTNATTSGVPFTVFSFSGEVTLS